MITDGDTNWHYLAIKNISRLLRGIKSNHNGHFYCFNCLHSYRAKSILKKHEKICKNYDFCNLKMLIITFYKVSQGKNHLKMPLLFMQI